MRIGIFSESYEPIVNGVSVCVSTLRDELAKRGHEVFVFAPRFKGHVDEHKNTIRLPARHTFLMPDYPFPIPYAPQAARLFPTLNLDIVHTQTPFLLGAMGAKWARRHGVPLVSTNHTLYTEYAHYAPIRPKAITRNFLIGLMKWYYSGCDAVVTPSTPVRDRLRSYGITTRIEIIKTGVLGMQSMGNVDRNVIRRNYGIRDDEFLLLYVGRIAREKNLRMLLQAFEMVLRQHDNARLLLVGGGPALVETERYAAELGLTGKLHFAGMMPRKDVEPVYRTADAFVFPSTTETQGLAICEALTAGLPVVAVNAGGIPENIQPGVDGFLTNDDPREFAEKIDYLITNPDKRKQMADAATINARSFSIDRMVDDFEAFYLSVIESSTLGTTVGTK